MMILSTMSQSFFEIFPLQQTEVTVSTLEMKKVKNICKILGLISNDLNFFKQYDREYVFFDNGVGIFFTA